MDNKSEFISVGIDVSSETLDVFLMNQQEEGKHKVFNNNEQGVAEIIAWLEKYDFHRKIVMESTGRYHEYIAVTLFTKGYDTYVINPLRVKKYQQAGIQKVKTDKHDAKILAEMGIKEKVLDAFTFTHADLATKKKISLVRAMEKKMQELRAMMQNYQESQEKLGINLSEIEKSLQKNINNLDKLREKLEKEVIAAVFPQENTKAQTAKEVLTSVTGISPYYAALIYFFYSLNKGSDINSWVAYTGLAVTVSQSGKWRGIGKLSKRGNRYLRKRNFSAGWGAYMHDEGMKEYYEYLKTEKNRKHKEAMVIIGRKMLRIAYSCLKNEKKYNPQIMKDLMQQENKNPKIKK